MRIGHGYDVHRLVKNRGLILGGVKIDYKFGLLGHSDADVLTHSIMDSLLGAAGLRDIGYYFPDSDKKYLNISSLKLLEEVVTMLNNKNYKIINIDSTIIAQEPKLQIFLSEMRTNISKSCHIAFDDVNVKATTEENLGFTGNMEGIAVHSVCLIDKIIY